MVDIPQFYLSSESAFSNESSFMEQIMSMIINWVDRLDRFIMDSWKITKDLLFKIDDFKFNQRNLIAKPFSVVTRSSGETPLLVTLWYLTLHASSLEHSWLNTSSNHILCQKHARQIPATIKTTKVRNRRQISPLKLAN